MAEASPHVSFQQMFSIHSGAVNIRYRYVHECEVIWTDSAIFKSSKL